MKTFIRTYFEERFAYAVIAFFYALGIALPVCAAFSLPVSTFFVGACCFFFTALFSLLSGTRRARMLRALLTLVLAAGFVLARFASFSAFIPGFLSLGPVQRLTAVQIYAPVLVPALCFLLCRLAVGVCAQDMPMFSVLAIWAAALILALTLLAPSLGFLYYVPLLLSLLAAFGVHAPWQTSLSRVAPLACLCLLLAVFVIPAQGLINPPLAELARRTRQWMEDYLFFTESRTVYSLQLSGYQPYGREQMGGPIAPTDEPVMEVRTPGTVLLRGVIKNEYTGSSWHDTTSSNRYLFIDPRFQGLRASLFDLKLPPSPNDADSALLAPVTVSVQMKKPLTSTLFVPARMQTIRASEGLVPYFSPSSEVFVTRDLAAGDTYTVSAPAFTAATSGLAEAVARAQGASDAGMEDISALYTALPAGIDGAVYQLAHAITQDAATPFAQAQALCDFLRSQYSYTYDQSVPPEGSDFVSWFLLSERKGYCVSYASAMAVMGRILGLPTRYVEGYVAAPDADGVARVTEKNAHAWVEVYFSGFGWVPFDPTAGSNTGGEEGDESLSSPEADDTPEEDTQAGAPPPSAQDGEGEPTPLPPDVTPPPEDGEAAPTPTPTPSPTPQGDGATPSPTPEPPDGNPSPSPTPPPTPEPPEDPQASPTPPPSPTPPADEPPPEDNEDDAFARRLLLLLVALLVAFVVYRLIATDPVRLSARASHPRAQMLVWYRAILLSLSCMGLEKHAGESPLMHARRARRALDGAGTPDSTGVCRSAYLVSRGQYSLHGVQEADVQILRRTYEKLHLRMKPLHRALMLVRRVVRGLGDAGGL